jgi:hypothetical protein
MTTRDDLGDFVRDALNHGVSREEIHGTLRGAGWAEPQVSAALARYAESDLPLAVPRPRPSLSAREAFEYVVLFGTLYFSAFSLGQLHFGLIDLALPDPLWPPFRFQMIEGFIRWSISALVVSTPVFLYAAWSNGRRLEADPLKRASPVRRWLTYATLAITASVLIGDCTSLVYNLLGGDLTRRFLLKTATVGVIAGTAFVYYLSDLRRDERELGA